MSRTFMNFVLDTLLLAAFAVLHKVQQYRAGKLLRRDTPPVRDGRAFSCARLEVEVRPALEHDILSATHYRKVILRQVFARQEWNIDADGSHVLVGIESQRSRWQEPHVGWPKCTFIACRAGKLDSGETRHRGKHSERSNSLFLPRS